MDLGEADELDYEDDLANDSFECGSQNKDLSEKLNLSGCEDNYLQIDCQEDEENFFTSTTPAGNIFVEIQNDERENAKPSGKGTSTGVEQSSQTSADNYETTTPITITSYQNNLFKDLSASHESPENNFQVSQNVQPGSFSHSRYQQKQVSPRRDFSLSKSWPIPSFQQGKNLQQLMISNMQTYPFHTINNIPPIGVRSKKFNSPQRRHKPFSRHFFGTPFNKNGKKFQMDCGKATFSEKGSINLGAKSFTENENIRKKSVFEQVINIRNRKNKKKYSNMSYAVERNRWNGRKFHDKNFTGSGSGPGSGPGSGSDGFGFFKKNTNYHTEYNFLKDDEKKLISLKKEARLKRFSNDDVFRKEKIANDSATSENYQNFLQFEEDYFLKMAEQKLVQERLLSVKGKRRKNSNCESDQNSTPEKPNISKESLLKKRNPFDESSGSLELLSPTEIKQESPECIEIKEEYVDEKFLTCINVSSSFTSSSHQKDEKIDGLGLLTVKNESATPVKFVRTVSKCFDELAFKRPKTEVIFNKHRKESPFSHLVKTFHTVKGNNINSLIHNIPAQIESQLTGCIVKVLNIPPSTTTNDILALCCPVGMVREVKLNFPKENSVVIRFVEPASAEKFFSLYHGQKMNNYFLNVIIV